MAFKEGDRIHGFIVKSEQRLEEYRSNGIWLEHEKSGAQVYHVVNEDPENLFSFAFKTPASDSSGVPHIIEHSVLSGSRNYPLKDPFINLMKGSMQTFLNAMTYPDKTVYPGSSTLEKDYFNLMKVYADAVFLPLLKREVFHQEGRRVEIDDQGNLELTGVVYNEMKGAYASHESIVGEWAYRSLFPDTPYLFDSGGDPEMIPDLTYEQFLDFHKKYYQPSNCLIFLYGDIPTERNLEFLDREYLRSFERTSVQTDIPDQTLWDEPIRLTRTSPADDTEGKATIIINWLCDSVLDPLSVLSMEVLAEILLGNAGAPLSRAITESDLGEDLSPQSGLDTEIKQLVFSLGIRGAEPSSTIAFESFIEAELQKLVDEGIPEDVVSGAVKHVEFLTREIKGGIPFGLRLMGKSLRGWLHGATPESTIEFAPWIAKLKNAISEGGYFEKLITERLLNNNHRSTLTVVPDHEHNDRIDQARAERLERQKKSMTDAEKEEILKDASELQRFQEEPELPEVLDTIPSLERSDLPKSVENIENSEIDLGAAGFLYGTYTNGIAYIDLAFDAAYIDEALDPYIPMFCKAISSVGLPSMPYHEVARQLSLVTGGFAAYPEISALPGNTGSAADGETPSYKEHVFLRMKCLAEDISDAMGLVGQLITNADFSDLDRIRDLLFEFRNDYKSSIMPSGHSLVALRSGSRLSSILGREEIWRGTDQFLFLSALAEDDDAPQIISERLSEIRNQLLDALRLSVSITVDDESAEDTIAVVKRWLSDLPARKDPDLIRRGLPEIVSVDGVEALVAPAPVGYVASVAKASAIGDAGHAHEVILAHLLRTEHLWERVRMRGGAYGASASANGGECLFTFSSYRDPNIIKTFDAFMDSLHDIAENGITEDSLTKAVIGVVGRDVRPMSPGQRGIVALRRNMYHISYDMRQQKRDALIAARPANIADAARRIAEALESGASAVLAGRQSVESAATERSDIGKPTVTLPM